MRLALMLLALLVLTPADASAAAVRCGAPQAQTLAAGGTTRVFRTPDGWIRTCLRGQRGSRLVCTVDACPKDDLVVRLRDGLVLVAGNGPGVAFVVDPRTGKDATPEYLAPVGARLDGVAFGRGGGSALAIGLPDGQVQIRRSAGCGDEVLHAGPDVDGGSLRLRGSVLRWRGSGRLRTAPACPTAALARARCATAAGASVLAVGRTTVAIDISDDLLHPMACAGTRRHGDGELGEFDELLDVAVGGGWMATSTETCGHDDCIQFVTAVDARTGRTERTTRFERPDAGSLRVTRREVRWSERGRPQRLRLP